MHFSFSSHVQLWLRHLFLICSGCLFSTNYSFILDVCLFLFFFLRGGGFYGQQIRWKRQFGLDSRLIGVLFWYEARHSPKECLTYYFVINISVFVSYCIFFPDVFLWQTVQCYAIIEFICTRTLEVTNKVDGMKTDIDIWLTHRFSLQILFLLHTLGCLTITIPPVPDEDTPTVIPAPVSWYVIGVFNNLLSDLYAVQMIRPTP